MSFFADILSSVFERRRKGLFGRGDDDRPVEEQLDSLLEARGEAEIQRCAESILFRYDQLDGDGKARFFGHLAGTMDIDAERVRDALDQYQAAPSRATYSAYMESAEPARQEVFRRLNHVPGATAKLVRMRADLLALPDADAGLQALDQDLRHLLSIWFNHGFLVLRRISWETPAHILERIIAYQAVHAVNDWDDLRRRLEPVDRRCFGFFHPAMPDDPLIFVEVALTRGVASSVQALLAGDREPLMAEEADTAIFYSISNCHSGLAGISFGNSLIKQVAGSLAAEIEGLKTFATLSPIPRLAPWLKEQGIDNLPDDPKARTAAAAHYLLNAKGRSSLPYDPVARFHLGNGAIVHALHDRADISDKGLAQSMGVMVNYLYDRGKVEVNSDRFETDHRIQASQEVKALAKSFRAGSPGEARG